jgi:hypothetical protein
VIKYSPLNGIVLSAVLCFLPTGAALGSQRAEKPVSLERQQWLMERFGDQGIDGNDDGVLTVAEVRAFLAERPRLRGDGTGPWGRRGPRPGGARSERHGGDPLRLLVLLDKETRPAQLTAEQLPEADLDGDGQISDEEWETHAAQRRAQLLAMLLERWPEVDADGDGAISDEELSVFRAARMAEARKRILLRHPSADTDGDGALSDEEFDAFRAERIGDRTARILSRHPEADLDGDGVLSDEEVAAFRLSFSAQRRARLLERHPEADVDGDGVLSDEEMAAFERDRPGRGPARGPGAMHRRGRQGEQD